MGEPGLTVLRIQTREPLWHPDLGLKELFVEAFAAEWMPDGEDAWAWCGSVILNPNVAVFVARDDEMKWVGLAVCDFAEDVWSPNPIVLGLYSTGREVMEALLVEIRAWGLSLGQETIRFINGTKHSDEAYGRLVSRFAETETQGSVIEATWRTEDGI